MYRIEDALLEKIKNTEKRIYNDDELATLREVKTKIIDYLRKYYNMFGGGKRKSRRQRRYRNRPQHRRRTRRSRGI